MHILSLNFTILKFCGVWRPLPWHTGWKFVLYNCYTLIITFFISTFIVSEFIDLVSSFDSVEEFAQGSFMLLSIITVFGKMMVFLIKRREIIELTNDLVNDVCEPRDAAEIQIQARSKRDARWITSWCSVLFMSTAFLMILQSIIMDLPERKLLFEGWFPYAYNSTQIVFLFTYFHQAVTLSTGATVNSAFDTLFPGLIILTCSQMKILKYRFEAIPQIISARKKSSESNGDEDDEKKNRELETQLLTDCIRHHVRIFRLADTLNEIFGFVIFLQFSISSLVLCVNVYRASRMKIFSTEFVPIIMYLASLLTQIFIMCYYGNELSLESMDICEAVYSMDWTSLSPGMNKSLMVIMLCSQRPITFICYSVISLSLVAFTRLIKLSYSVFNIFPGTRCSKLRIILYHSELMLSHKRFMTRLDGGPVIPKMHILSLNFTIFKFLGLWRPLSWLTGWKFVLYNCYTVIVVLFVFTFVVSEFIELFCSFNSVEEFAQGSFVLLSMIAMSGKMAVLLIKRREIIALTNDLVNDVCEPRNAVEIQIQARSKHNARWIASRYVVLFVSTAFLMVLQSIIMDIPERKLMFKGWLPYAYNSTQIVFLFTYFHQVVTASAGATVNSAFDTLFPGLIILTCAQMNTLKHRFEAMPQIIKTRITASESNGDEDDEKKNRELEAQLLTDCIRHHVRIFQLANTLNGIFGFVIFLQFSISTLVLCVSVYEVSRMKIFSIEFVPIIMYLASMLTQIFILCYYGNELSLQSMDICEAVYSMDWTSLSTGMNKSLIVIMLCSQRPITFICYNVISLSLVAFTRLIKLSYSVFNVISQND
ncbi:uncharacterized protein [Venturia canescens]|uniref:uncharacterized protein n=1 Tax=Venturia canescens TaxID=32260 RepID=UPI001C9BEF69|nr:uncharacterized protein LOC122416609 [Venturia canescens]